MNRPWLTDDANAWLSDNLPDGHCFEWGSGRSTIWLAERMKSVATVEHDQLWYARLPSLPNVRCYLVPLNEEYAQIIHDYDWGHFDLIVIDGRRRNQCVGHALIHSFKDTLIVFDDAQRSRYKPGLDLMKNTCDLVHSSKDPDGKVTTIWRRR